MDRVQAGPEVPLHAFPLFVGRNRGEHARNATSSACEDVIRSGRLARTTRGGDRPTRVVQGSSGGGRIRKVTRVSLEHLCRALTMSLEKGTDAEGKRELPCGLGS